MIEIISVLIATISTSFDVYDHLIRARRKKMNNALLYGFKYIAPSITMWKDIHTKFHAMRFLFRELSKTFYDSNGKIKDNISLYSDKDKDKIKSVLCDVNNSIHIADISRLYNKYSSEITRAIASSQKASAKINYILNDNKLSKDLVKYDIDVLKEALDLETAQNNVSMYLTQLNEVVGNINRITMDTSWHDNEFSRIISNRHIFLSVYDNIIAQTDNVLMIILDIQLWLFAKIESSK